MDKDLNDLKADNRSTVSALKKKWGKPKTGKEGDTTTYTWKKGKTQIWVNDRDPWEKNLNLIEALEVDIKDKNGAVWGVTVGMKKDAALKKLKKVFGNKVYKQVEDGDEFVGIVENKKSIEAFTGPLGAVTFQLKNGKVSSIYFFRC